jgi:hypothetical protein
VQVDPIKPKSKPHGTKRLKLNYDVELSTTALKFDLRRYIAVHRCYPLAVCPGVAPDARFFSYTLHGLALDALLVVVGTDQ